LLRSAMFAGAGASNYQVETFRGTPSGRGKLSAELVRKGKRLPCILPWGKKYLQSRVQFVHVEDVARVITFILRKSEPESRRLTVLNVAGRGEPITLKRCVEIAKSKLLRVPGEWTMRQLLRLLGKIGISGSPPEAAEYLSGNAIMNTDRLREFLGPYHEDVIRYTVSDAFADCFASSPRPTPEDSAKA
jgi:nucleoside-diphosphate-sugar epimerase